MILLIKSVQFFEKNCFGISESRYGGAAMKQLLNTLFVTSEDVYLSLEGENVLANRDQQVLAGTPCIHSK